uniref:Prothymosin alpha n=1 Tax=Salmo trutta TaxID=8032 RepID=A0A673VV60_SALTR
RVCACVTTFSFLLDLKEKKLVEEAENGKDTPANGKAEAEENGDQDNDVEEEDDDVGEEEDEEDDAEGK